jgi:N-acetyl-anhydromuramyl-L-alanine amidase AmpD
VAQGNVNNHTIGIEFIGDGNLTEEQYWTAVALTQQLSGEYGIPIDGQHIIGHSDINSVGRNLDPGPYFPMQEVIADAAGR